MRVVAKSLGYYQHRRYREGTEFRIDKPEDIRSWMEPLDERDEAPERVPRKARKEGAG